MSKMASGRLPVHRTRGSVKLVNRVFDLAGSTSNRAMTSIRRQLWERFKVFDAIIVPGDCGSVFHAPSGANGPSSTMPLKNAKNCWLPTAVGSDACCGKQLTSLRTPSTRTPRPTFTGNGLGLVKDGINDPWSTLLTSFKLVVVTGSLPC